MNQRSFRFKLAVANKNRLRPKEVVFSRLKPLVVVAFESKMKRIPQMEDSGIPPKPYKIVKPRGCRQGEKLAFYIFNKKNIYKSGYLPCIGVYMCM